MARTSKDPKKFIISCRVNDKEMQALHALSEESGLSISTLLRKSLGLAEKHFQNQATASA